MQAECLASAYRLWKRQWKGPGKEYCGGALVWQINDCWPVTSWAIVDYYLRPKHAYYTVKREMAPISLGITRKEHIIPKDKYTRAHLTKTTKIEIWGSNLSLKDITADVVVKAFDVITGQETFSKTVASTLLLPENRSTEIIAMDVPVRKANADEESRTVVAAYLIQDGIQIARYINWPEPLKYVHLQKPKHLRAELSQDGKIVEINSDVPVKGVALECSDENVRFEDNLIDIVPGEVVRVAAGGTSEGTDIGTMYLGAFRFSCIRNRRVKCEAILRDKLHPDLFSSGTPSEGPILTRFNSQRGVDREVPFNDTDEDREHMLIQLTTYIQ
ncbi:hypothetical protein EYC84_004862 [Monilinia fructicola]|uniref:Uncharacterized protein n=1 Tax=Monilinia fructicola TaxID=38448 RepID=A0A5M9K1S3_MONFR|nr:hypothetical protein EYC84_004862 [Monilinia fructicola]